MGLMDYNARWYGQTVGAFTQPDSIVPGFGNPQTLNRFSYVYNNPTNNTDPSGHKVPCPDDGCGGPPPPPQEPDDPILPRCKRYPEKCAKNNPPGDIDKDLDPHDELVEYIDTCIANQWGQVKSGLTRLEAMALIVDQAALLYGEDWELMLDSLSLIFLGVSQHGFGMLRGAADATAPYEFTDSGFHLDYRDGTNQVLHVWGYIANSAVPNAGLGSSWAASEAALGNVIHERPWESGASTQDLRLGEAGIFIGGATSFGTIPPNQLGNLIRAMLGQDGPGYNFVP